MQNTYKKTILYNLGKMEYILSELLNHKKKRVPIFNKLVDAFVLINNTIESYDDDLKAKSESARTNLSNLLVDSIEAYNKKKHSEFASLLGAIKNEFVQWSDFTKEHCKFKVIVFGVNHTIMQIQNIVDSSKADIVCLADDTGEHLGKVLNDIQINELGAAVQNPFDFMISAPCFLEGA
ncbi:hypothetical protein [Domibacillus iocasae]|uniref:Uncharacterized protein n=1 Tax=Domibacillus iocasae TaxID=1714016 RepID=A0A1E7DSM1_9BACI|nr:hypothetical protein [Domibacillus iocasae]OES46072.1 hypothetical protein BA724_15905 [Domibacillus iocasae]